MWYSAIIKATTVSSWLSVRERDLSSLAWVKDRNSKKKRSKNVFFFKKKILNKPKNMNSSKKKKKKKEQKGATPHSSWPSPNKLLWNIVPIRSKDSKNIKRERIRSSRDWWATVRQTGRPPLSKRCSLFALWTTSKLRLAQDTALYLPFPHALLPRPYATLFHVTRTLYKTFKMSY